MPKALARDFLVYGLGAGLSQSLLILLVPIYSRVFSVEEYGAMELIQSGFILMSVLGLLQLESAAGRFYFEAENISSKRSQLSTGFWAILMISVLISIIFFLFASYLTDFFFSNQEYYSAILIVVAMLPFANLFNYFAVLIRFEKKPIAYGVITFIQLGITASLAVCLVVYLDWGIEGVFYAQAIGFVAGLIFYIIFFRKFIKLQFDRNVLRKYFDFSLPMVPGVIGNWANNHANRFVMLSLLSIKEIGIYAVAVKIASVFKLLEYAFRMAWGPYFIEQYKKPGHRKVYQRVLRYVVLAFAILICLFSLFAKEIIMLVTTPDYYSSILLVGFTGFAFALVAIGSIVGVGSILTTKTIYNTYSSFAGIGVNFGLLFLLVPKFGIVTVPISMLAGFLSTVICQWYFSEKLYNVGYSKLDFGLFFLATLFLTTLFTFVINPSFTLKIAIGFILTSIGYFIFRRLYYVPNASYSNL